MEQQQTEEKKGILDLTVRQLVYLLASMGILNIGANVLVANVELFGGKRAVAESYDHKGLELSVNKAVDVLSLLHQRLTDLEAEVKINRSFVDMHPGRIHAGALSEKRYDSDQEKLNDRLVNIERALRTPN